MAEPIARWQRQTPGRPLIVEVSDDPIAPIRVSCRYVDMEFTIDELDGLHNSSGPAALDVARRLAERGARLTAVDPLINPEPVPSFVRIVPLTTEHVERADLVLVLTDHDALDWSLLEQWPARILDTRNRVKAPEAERL